MKTWPTIILLLLLSFSSFAEKSQKNLDLTSFELWPAQHEGRIQPISVVAEYFLYTFAKKRSWKGRNASSWLARVLFQPESSYEEEIFRIDSKDLKYELELKDVKHFSFNQLAEAFAKKEAMIKKTFNLPEEQRSRVQKELVDLYTMSSQFYELSRSLTAILLDFELSEAMATRLSAKKAQMSYLEFKKYIEPLKKVEGMEAKALMAQWERYEEDRASSVLRIYQVSKDQWLSPWQILERGYGTPATAEFFSNWQSVAENYRRGDDKGWGQGWKSLARFKENMGVISTSLEWQKRYQDWSLVAKTASLYLLSFFLLLLAGRFGWPKIEKMAEAGFYVALVLHLGFLLLRVYILRRPPVTSLYESTLFVSFVVSIVGVFLRSQSGLLLAGLLSGSLLFLSFSWLGASTMTPVVAVLDTHFWLLTHVIVISAGYALCLLTSVAAHFFLWRWPRLKEKQEHLTAFRHLLWLSAFSLFLTAFGTALGGIWADQSWGRFWGWDPKENGALLIVLWLLWILHGHIGQLLSQRAVAFNLVLLNIVVALAWFGVNLLSVGLHSYGFTAGVFWPLLAFCLGEILLGMFLFRRARVT